MTDRAPQSSAAPPVPEAPTAPAAPPSDDAHRLRAAAFLSRLLWGSVSLAGFAVVATALWLDPDARGFGTHQQLGLPPCNFSRIAHVPCPGCGLTTSFAHMAHFHLVDAFRAHLMGPLLFLLTLGLAVYGPFAIARRRPVSVVLDAPASLPVLAVTALLGVLTFVLRLMHILPSN